MKKPARIRRPRHLPLSRRPLEWGPATIAIALVVIAITSLGSGSSTGSAATKRTATVGKGVIQSTVPGVEATGGFSPASGATTTGGSGGEGTGSEAETSVESVFEE